MSTPTAAAQPAPLSPTASRRARTIGVGVDASVESSVALAWALDRAKRTGDAVRLVTIVEEEPGSMGSEYAQEVARARRPSGCPRSPAPSTPPLPLRERSDDLDISARRVFRAPVDGLVGLARHASLLVLGRSRVPELNPLGTTCHRILSQAPAPVLVADIGTSGGALGSGGDDAHR